MAPYDPDFDPLWKAHVENLERQAEEKRRAKLNPPPPAELAETSLELFRDLLEVTQADDPEQWIFNRSQETVYNDDGDHGIATNLRLVADYFETVECRIESLVNALAWSGQAYAENALNLLTKVHLVLTERSSRERSELSLGLEYGQHEQVVRYFCVLVERLRLLRTAILNVMAQIRTVREMDRSEERDERDDDGRFDDLGEWVRDNLKGKQRRVLELTIDADGECPLAAIAIDRKVSWEAPYDDAFNGIRKAVNPKLHKIGWKLERNDNNSRLAKLGQE